MNNTIPTVHLKNAWKSSHPWIFQRLVAKPAQRPRAGEIVDVISVDGEMIGRGFYNGHSRIALRMLDRDPNAVIEFVDGTVLLGARRQMQAIHELCTGAEY